MEKFDKEKLIKLGIKYYDLMNKDKFKEQDEFKKKYITGTIYEEYFDGENLERSEVVDRILEGYKKIKNYDLESIFLLGIAQNNTEYMLPLIEKVVIENVLKNEYEFQDISQFMTWEKTKYKLPFQIYYNKTTCGINILGMLDILGVVENFEEKEYEEVTEEDEKKFIELIKIFENTEIQNYLFAQSNLRESLFFSIEKRKEYTKEDVENEIRGNKEYQELTECFDNDTWAKLATIICSTDEKRTSGIINGLWILGLIRTKDNINGFNYSKTKRIGISPVRWFASEKYIIDYETIKKYFGKYNLIREFCDSRETQKLEEEKDTFEKILPYLEQMKNKVEVNKDEAEKVLREVPKEEVKEILEKIEKYLKDNEIGTIKFDTGGMRTREHVFGFFEENVGVEN